MRHRKAGVKLGRTSSHRDAMFRNMVTSLLKYDAIRTTDVKAKELRRWADQIITLAKRGDLHARRQAMAIVREKNVVHKLFEEAGKRFGEINGGYTRIVKLGRRPGDAAPVSLIEIISISDKEGKGKKAKTEPSKKIRSQTGVKDSKVSHDSQKTAETAPVQPEESIKALADNGDDSVQTGADQDRGRNAPIAAADKQIVEGSDTIKKE